MIVRWIIIEVRQVRQGSNKWTYTGISEITIIIANLVHNTDEIDERDVISGFGDLGRSLVSKKQG